jgi:Regulator of ribonuclease activity B
VPDELSDEELHVFWPGPIEGETPPELSTGNPEDDQLLQQIAARVQSLDRLREWIHYVTAPDEPSAQIVARVLSQIAYKDVGFEVEIYQPEAPGEDYVVRAMRQGTILTAELVRSSRDLFETVISRVPGADYHGWEVSVDDDEILGAIPDAT